MHAPVHNHAHTATLHCIHSYSYNRLVPDVLHGVPRPAEDGLQLGARAQVAAQAGDDEAESGLAREDACDGALRDAGVSFIIGVTESSLREVGPRRGVVRRGVRGAARGVVHARPARRERVLDGHADPAWRQLDRVLLSSEGGGQGPATRDARCTSPA